MSAAFSALLPRRPAARFNLVVADPPDARIPLANSAEAKGNAVLIDRGGCSFTTKVKHAVLAEVACIIVSNSQDGPELFSMGGCDAPLLVPAALVSKESGLLLRKWLDSKPEKTGEISLCSSDGYELAVRRIAPPGASELHYIAKTQPIEFMSTDGKMSFVPQEGVVYPQGPPDKKEAPRDSCALCCAVQ